VAAMTNRLDTRAPVGAGSHACPPRLCSPRTVVGTRPLPCRGRSGTARPVDGITVVCTDNAGPMTPVRRAHLDTPLQRKWRSFNLAGWLSTCRVGADSHACPPRPGSTPVVVMTNIWWTHTDAHTSEMGLLRSWRGNHGLCVAVTDSIPMGTGGTSEWS